MAKNSIQNLLLMNYAAFIITYERPKILLNTIDVIFSQTFPPEKILVVDNSDSDDTRQIIKKLDNPLVEYYNVGYNSGPSGGAYIGLQLLAKEDFDWLFWVDDDNPPEENYIIEQIFEILDKVDVKTCGQLGLVGNRFHEWSGELERIGNDELQSREIIEIDSVGGGQCKIISSKVARQGILPTQKLFFGFEELDLDLKIKKAGFKSYISGKLLYESRKRSNRLNWKNPKMLIVDQNQLSRHYYSIRNLLAIYKANRLYSALIFFTLKKMFSIPLAFKNGSRKGKEYTKIVFLAYKHFLVNKYGKIDLNLQKT